MYAQPILTHQTHQTTEKVIPFPGNRDGEAKLATASALWAAFDTGIYAALRDVPVGPASQAVYTALLRRLPNVRPGLTRLASDTGLSRSTVLRALTTLESIRLIKRHRSEADRGGSDTTVYKLADLRDKETATQCHALVRQLIKKPSSTSSKGGRRTGASSGGRRMGAPSTTTRVKHRRFVGFVR